MSIPTDAASIEGDGVVYEGRRFRAEARLDPRGEGPPHPVAEVVPRQRSLPRHQCFRPKLISLVENDLGYELYRSVETTKVALSKAEAAPFQFHHADVELDAVVTRADFESWIAPELESIRSCVDRLLASTGVDARAVDRVFLTGGSSLVPAVRRIFVERFGEARVRSGNELTSVALGLALVCADRAALQRA